MGERIPIGYVRRAHGIRGAVVVRPLTDRPDERFVPGAAFSTDEAEARLLHIESSAEHSDGFIVSFAGINDRDQATALRGVSLTIDAAARRGLAAEEYWTDQLVGCAALDREGQTVWVGDAVVSGAAQDRLIVRTNEGSAIEIPFVDALVPEVDVEGRTIVIDPPAGLLP
jgi:16S rRNA processing protein RimM